MDLIPCSSPIDPQLTKPLS
jgi:hypothetical protein